MAQVVKAGSAETTARHMLQCFVRQLEISSVISSAPNWAPHHTHKILQRSMWFASRPDVANTTYRYSTLKKLVNI